MSSWIKRTALAAVATAALMGAASAEVVYNRANSGEPETLDTHKTSTVQESHILRDMLEGLVTYSAKGEAVPGQAEKWEVSDDGKTYRFTLRNGLKWSNGDPVTAEDFVYSYRRIMDPATGAKYANILYPIKNAEKINKGQDKPVELVVKALDDKTVEITLESTTPYFIEMLTHQSCMPVHKA
ncbi:MAG: ABC transporter substrate-binding protein, partial [Microvirga sp.]